VVALGFRPQNIEALNPPLQLGSDENGEPIAFDGEQVVPVVNAADADKAARDEERALRLEIACRLVDWLVRGATTPDQVGRRAVLCAWNLGAPSLAFKKQKDLAAWLGISEVRLVQLKKKLAETL
jgi:hypothetical protein